MPDVIINVTPQSTASVEVDVDNVASYYYELAKQWAISPDLVEFLDYSSKHYAFVSKGYKEEVDALLSDSGFIAVKNDLANIDTVADSIANVNTTAGNITNINTVADINSNVTTVAGISTDITAVNNNATNINACVSNASNINTVAGSIANVNTVAGDKTNIDTVAGISGNITTVAGISTAVTGVASISSAVSAVNTNASNINTCATNIGDINTCAANISTIADKVSKSGDTMTGDLIIRNANLVFTSVGGIYTRITGEYNYPNLQLILSSGIDSANKENFILNYDIYNRQGSVSASAGIKQSITNWAYPSSSSAAITIGASGSTYTATANGYIVIKGTQTGTNGYVFLINQTSSIEMVGQPPGVDTFEIRCFIPVAKGDTYVIIYDSVNISSALFVSAIGG